MKRSLRVFLKRITVVVLAVAVLICAAACSSVPEKIDNVRVTLMPSEYYELVVGCESSVVVPRGGSARFKLRVNPKYEIIGSSIDDTQISTDGEITVVSVIEPKYSVRVSLKFRLIPETPMNNAIVYKANGGQLQNGGDEMVVPYKLNGHLRPNTAIGTDKLVRDGYTLVGWNTQADGGGKHYGLGSRCDIDNSAMTTLYAEWQMQTDVGEFEYRIDEPMRRSDTDGETVRTVTITKWQLANSREEGEIFDAATVCVPEFIDGLPVTRIARGAFLNANIEKIILPKTIVSVDNKAFGRSYIRDLWFFDNIMHISDGAFLGGYMPRLHINAVLSPKFCGYDRHSNYADKVDILRSHRNDKKIVLFGGSGTYFSIDSQMIYDAFDGEYAVINMGVNGWFSSIAQSDIIMQYLRDGDIFIHIPEMQSRPQLFDNIDFAMEYDEADKVLLGETHDDRYFRAIESNYDMISVVNFNRCPGVLNSFNRFNKSRRKMMNESSYSDNADCIDEFGDYNMPKPSIDNDVAISDEAGINAGFLTDAALTRLNVLYGKVTAVGAVPYVAYAAVNRHALIANDEKNFTDYKELALQYSERLRGNITEATVIGDIFDAIMDGHLFFNSDWHLSDDGTVVNTQKLIDNLKSALLAGDEAGERLCKA